jgi:hypothetical protein
LNSELRLKSEKKRKEKKIKKKKTKKNPSLGWMGRNLLAHFAAPSMPAQPLSLNRSLASWSRIVSHCDART